MNEWHKVVMLPVICVLRMKTGMLRADKLVFVVATVSGSFLDHVQYSCMTTCVNMHKLSALTD
jgi:hypothetical protein